MKTSVIEVHDMLSVFSVDEVEQRIGDVPGVESVTVNHAAGSATVRYDETRLELADIKSTVRQRGYDSAALAAGGAGNGHEGHKGPGAPSAAPAASKSVAPPAIAAPATAAAPAQPDAPSHAAGHRTQEKGLPDAAASTAGKEPDKSK